jgi:signal transduction histidine kinase
MAKIELPKKIPITTKFILWFLFIALIPFSIATLTSHHRSRKALEEEIANSLFVVANNKANQIRAYLDAKLNNITMLSNMSDVLVAMEQLDKAFSQGRTGQEEYQTLAQEYQPFLSYYQRSFGYDNLYLINPNGDVIFSVKKREEPKSLYEVALFRDSELTNAFIKAKRSLKTEMSHFEFNADTGESAAFIVAPVVKGGGLAGVVAVQMSNEGLTELVSDYTGLGETGETLIASKIDDEAMFVTPLRFDPDAAFIKKIAIGSKEGVDIQKAVEGKKGSGLAIDYRGKDILSVWRHLPKFRLGMVVKMDTDEVFSSAQRLRNDLLKFSFALMAIVTFVAVLIARTISRPIKALTSTSSTIASGDLSARAQVHTNDEIGDLANTFNQMTDSLVQAKAHVEQKKAEVEEQKLLLEKVNKELDSFVYTVSHDLRAPLRGVSSFASFLEEDYKEKLGDEGKDYVEEIRKGIHRLDLLISDLLKLSRISRIKNPYEDVNINELIKSIVERIKVDIQEYKVGLKIQDTMPKVYCDRIKIGEVFLNLINNAIKYSSKNKKENPKVEVSYTDANEFHTFSVKDNGIGIDPQYHDQIFGIFKRLHTAEQYEGTGAGLSIVKRIIDDHGGTIWVESAVGKGATFYFTIPKGLKQQQSSG